jgi:hypothetical protein
MSLLIAGLITRSVAFGVCGVMDETLLACEQKLASESRLAYMDELWLRSGRAKSVEMSKCLRYGVA